MSEDSHLWREDLGAYLVGALEPDEAARLRRHLEQCAACRAEYEELAPVVGLLATVPGEALTADGAPSAPPDPEGWERLRARAGLAGPAAPAFRPSGRSAAPGHATPGGAAGNGFARPVNRTRPRRSPRRPLQPVAVAAVSGALVAAVAFGVYAGVHRDGGPAGVVAAGTETVSAANASDGVSGTVQYRPTDWGSWVQITLKGVKPGDACVLYAMDGKGNKATASTWWAPPALGESATIPGGVSMQAWDIKQFQVTTPVGNVLLTIPAS
jgi:anti-sigma factor RsiW